MCLFSAGARPGSAGQLRSAASLLHTAGSGLLAAGCREEHGQAAIPPSGVPVEQDGYASSASLPLMPVTVLVTEQ